MNQVFLTYRPPELRYGTTCSPVPRFEIRQLDERGRPVSSGELGENYVNGPTAPICSSNARQEDNAGIAIRFVRLDRGFRALGLRDMRFGFYVLRLRVVRQFMILETLPGCYLRIVQFV